MKKKKVLFVCVHNSARSQIAQELLNRMCSDEFEAQSAGLEPGVLNPLAVEVLREEGIDISGRETRAVFDILKSGQMFAYVIAVCDGANAQRCPIFPGVTTRLNWSFPDPSTFEGTWEEKLEQTREVRDMIEAKLQEFCGSKCLAEADRKGKSR
jgi:arsenate reductase